MLQTVFTLDLWEVEVPLACRRLPTDNGALEIERQKRVISGLAPNRTKPSGVPIVPAGTKSNSPTATASAIRPSNVFVYRFFNGSPILVPGRPLGGAGAFACHHRS
jgi:hypothetical protein